MSEERCSNGGDEVVVISYLLQFNKFVPVSIHCAEAHVTSTYILVLSAPSGQRASFHIIKNGYIYASYDCLNSK